MNATLNQCIKCYQITYNCNSCDTNGTCLGCLDGYYMSGFNCLSCSDIIKDCVLCNNGSICLLYTYNYTGVSTSNSNILTNLDSNVWMYITYGTIGFVLIIIISYIIYRKWRKNQLKK